MQYQHSTDNAANDNTADQSISDEITPTDTFLAFHHANPQVYRTLVGLAREWTRNGKVKCGIDLLWNTCRWRLSLEIEGEEQFELNNNFTPFYARALMHFEPDLAGIFNLRRAAEADAWIATHKNAQAA